MGETVRVVSDGSAAPKPVSIRYLGFHDGPGRREYVLDAQRGDQTSRYMLWIELSAFSSRHALLQDGPEICYQKLLRELAEAELHGSEGMAVTENDMAVYRDAHTRPVRRGFSS
jgi:hypothetical protein